MQSEIKKLAYGLIYDVKGRKSKVDELYDLQNIKDKSTKQLKRILIKHNVQSCAIAFLDEFGNDCYVCVGLNNNNTINNKTMFRLASISKLLLTIIALRLHERQIIDIYEDISDYLKIKLRNPLFSNEKITLEQILTHKSSIVDGNAYFISFSSNPPFPEILEFGEYKPGSKFSYSNFAYGVLGIALEKASGMSLEELLQEYICNVIDIKASYFPGLDDDVASSIRILNKRNTPNYCFDKNTYQKNQNYKALPLESQYLKAAGGVHCSASNLLKLAKALLLDNSGQNLLLSKDSIKLMQKITSSYNSSSVKMHYGMGMQIINDNKVCNSPLYGHEGFAYGSVNAFFYDIKKNKAIIQLNGGAREWCNGKLACLNQDIIKWYYNNY